VTRVVTRAAPIVLIIAIAFAGLGFLILRPAGLFNRYSDLLTYHLGTATVLYHAWQDDHVLPLWRSDELSGAPALTNPQALYTHPLHLLFALARPEQIVGLVIWLQMLLGALGAYYAGFALRLSVPGRLVVATATLFSFKTILAAYAGWLPILAGIAAMPLLFATAAIAMERPSWRSALALGGAGALSLHSGHLQLTYYSALFIALWSSVRIARLLARRDLQRARGIVGSLVLGGILSIGLSAYLMLPLARSAGLVTRSAGNYDFFLGDVSVSSLTLLTLLNPELFGSPLDDSFPEAWEYVAYLGAAVSLLAIAGGLRGRRHPYVPELTAGLLLSIALSLQSPLLRMVFALVPGYGLFRHPNRTLFLTAFFACCLAGVGLDQMRMAARQSRWRTAWAIAAVALIALEGSIWARRYLGTTNPVPAVAGGDYVAALRRGGEPARVAPLARSIPNYGSAASLGLEIVTGYEPFTMRHYQTYIDLVQRNETPGTRAAVWTDLDGIRRFDMLAALNVRYVVSPEPLELPAREYVPVGVFPQQPQFRFYEGLVREPVYVYRNERFLRRAFFVTDVRSADDEDGLIRQVQKADLRDTAIVASAASGVSTPSDGDRVNVLRSAGGALDLATHSGARRFLLVSEVWHPGWGARVDGVESTLHRADVALQGLWLEAGDHRIEIRFWPPGLTVGLSITGITALAVLALVATGLARRRP
jgi:hypothetical protein